MSLFYFFGGDGIHLPHPRLSKYTPEVETPAHSSAPGRLAHHRQQGRPRRVDLDGGGLGCLRSAFGKVYNFGRYIYTHLYMYFFVQSP